MIIALKTDKPGDRVQKGVPFKLTVTYAVDADGEAKLTVERKWSVQATKLKLPANKTEAEVSVVVSHQEDPTLPEQLALKVSLNRVKYRRILLEVTK